MNGENKINKYVDYIVEEYIKAGGDKKDADRNFTYSVLRGIYDREGEEALDEFVKNWKPHIPNKKYRGYC